jgi:hypothetical protein
MGPELVQTGIQVFAVALTLGAFVLLLNGGAYSLGWSCRSALEPLLASVRARSSRSRPELADASVVLAIGFALLSAVFEQLVPALLIVALLLKGRPLVRRATREENRLLALVGSLSSDTVIGFYLPMVLAQVLLTNLYIAASMSLVVVALSWPPGGGQAIPGRSWRGAPAL